MPLIFPFCITLNLYNKTIGRNQSAFYKYIASGCSLNKKEGCLPVAGAPSSKQNKAKWTDRDSHPGLTNTYNFLVFIKLAHIYINHLIRDNEISFRQITPE